MRTLAPCKRLITVYPPVAHEAARASEREVKILFLVEGARERGLADQRYFSGRLTGQRAREEGKSWKSPWLQTAPPPPSYPTPIHPHSTEKMIVADRLEILPPPLLPLIRNSITQPTLIK